MSSVPHFKGSVATLRTAQICTRPALQEVHSAEHGRRGPSSGALSELGSLPHLLLPLETSGRRGPAHHPCAQWFLYCPLASSLSTLVHFTVLLKQV